MGIENGTIEPISPQSYEVKTGDSLSRIAKDNGFSSWKDLAAIQKPGFNPERIKPGDIIRLKSQDLNQTDYSKAYQSQKSGRLEQLEKIQDRNDALGILADPTLSLSWNKESTGKVVTTPEPELVEKKFTAEELKAYGLNTEIIKGLESSGYKIGQVNKGEIVISGTDGKKFSISEGNPVKTVMMNLFNGASSYGLSFKNESGQNAPELVLKDLSVPKTTPKDLSSGIKELEDISSRMNPGSETTYNILSNRFSNVDFGSELKREFLNSAKFETVRDNFKQYILNEAKKETGWFSKSPAMSELASKGKDDVQITDFIKTATVGKGVEFTVDNTKYVIGSAGREGKIKIMTVDKANNPAKSVYDKS